jgi:hypothetical protein
MRVGHLSHWQQAIAATAVIAATAIVAAGGIVSAAGHVPGPAVSATVAPIPAAVRITAPPRPAGTSRIDRLVRAARFRYGQEVYGSAAHQQLSMVARDPRLRAALGSGDRAFLRAYVRSEYKRVWYHQHVSYLRIVRGSQILAETGVPFAVAPSQTALRDAHGRRLGTLQVSIQDEIGFVRYMHRNFPVQIVVRGRGPGHVLSSLPAAGAMTLPRHGTVDIGGRRFAVGSFHATAFGGEPVTIWVLAGA